MKIGIDALGIEKASGGRTATINLLQPLFEIDAENEYLIAVSSVEPLFKSKHDNVSQWVLPVHNRFLKRGYAQFSLPKKLNQYNVVHFTKNLSLFGITAPKIVTVYDLSMLKFPGLMPVSDYIYWNTIQRIHLKAAQRIVTISQSASNDIQHYYGIPQRKISVIYPAISPKFKPATSDEIEGIKVKYSLPSEYLLHVGRIDPIKNLTTLVKSFKKLKVNHLFDGKLVLAGEFYKKSPDNQLLPTIRAESMENEVLLLGYVPEGDLPALMSGATLKAFPSHNEGFGLAALEAMACGTPVVTSKAGGAVEEVVGDAGVIIDNINVDQLFDGLARVLSNPEYQVELRAKGLLRVKKFDWYVTARQTLEVYQQVGKVK